MKVLHAQRRRAWSSIFVTALMVGAALAVVAGPAMASQDILVPGRAPTIQAAIDAAADGDSVVVDPGTYYENIDYRGKRIEVRSSGGRDVTVIDGGGAGPAVTFASGEDLGSVLRGFTVRHGTPGEESNFAGGGVSISGSSPTIVGNLIRDNTGCNAGAGIDIVARVTADPVQRDPPQQQAGLLPTAPRQWRRWHQRLGCRTASDPRQPDLEQQIRRRRRAGAQRNGGVDGSQ
ncbi:MAG: hypothetical protein M3179_01040 [Actinomycetota bacterium]|nr:hypothetical protein [Actinomycetota bacterium]